MKVETILTRRSEQIVCVCAQSYWSDRLEMVSVSLLEVRKQHACFVNKPQTVEEHFYLLP